ncbi:MAG TPA: ABC transporter ATP-binding protein [Candidatus Dormibacteraeota bacterium]|nr:ABC transporter ATP-binding protein [Candidatus Dormibacteraeota bacterium]
MRLEVSDLSAGYGTSLVVSELGLTVEPGEVVAVIGRNGMGKTTFLRALLGLLPRRTGRVLIDGHDVSAEPTHRLVRRGIAYAPQEAGLFGALTVEENLRGGLLAGPREAAAWHEVLEPFPQLKGRLRQPAGTLSGGEQRMLLLARALVARPRLLVLDEVCDGLHPPVVAKVVEILREQRERRGVSVLIVEPNLQAVLGLADRVLLMKRGRFLLERSPSAPGAREDLEHELVFT